MSDDEESTCYSEDQKEAWNKAVHDLNIFHETVLPKVWKKGQSQEWTKVDSNFPAIDNFEFEELDDGYNAIEFCKKEAGNIDRTKGTRIEKSALDILQIAEEKKFMKIFKARKATWDTWMTLAKEYDELPNKECNDDVAVMKLNHEDAEPSAKPNIKSQMIKRLTEYRQMKAKFEDYNMQSNVQIMCKLMCKVIGKIMFKEMCKVMFKVMCKEYANYCAKQCAK